MAEVLRIRSSDEWRPSPVVALASSADGSQVAAAREDASLEIWLVSPGAAGWHCQLTIYGDPNSRVSSLVWCRSGSGGSPNGRLFSSSIDGSVSEWDLFHLAQKTVVETIGVSIWQMAAAPCSFTNMKQESALTEKGNSFDKSIGSGEVTSDSEVETDSLEIHEEPIIEDGRIALACDDGVVRIYSISESDELIYSRSMPRVSGRVLSVTWSPDATKIYSGSSDGFIRCWDAKLSHELYRITAGLGGLGSGSKLCIWSLLALRCGTLVSADSSGSVQFWDSRHGTLIQAHPSHKGHVNALAVAPSHSRVFSAGSDGQVILYKFSTESTAADGGKTPANVIRKWVSVGYVRAHTHDVRALTVAVPISREDLLPDEKVKRARTKKKPLGSSYNKWAHLGVPMLISAGDDTKLFAYSAKEFTKFAPHDICPAPQRPPIQLARNSGGNESHLLLVQASHWLNIFSVHAKKGGINNIASSTTKDLEIKGSVARVESKGSRRIICSAISSSGTHFAYSDNMRACLFELKHPQTGKNAWALNRKHIPRKLPYAHSLAFSFDSSKLMIAGHDRMIYVVDLGSLELTHRFTPRRKEVEEGLPPSEPPITKMFTSSDGQWLAAINCFGDVYIFNLEIQRQHWFISRLDGASITAGGFTPRNSNVLILSTSSNQVYAFDVDAKRLGEWSARNAFTLPRRYQDFPGEVTGLSFPPSSNSSTVIIYSARAMCFIDFGMPVEGDEDHDMVNGQESSLKKVHNTLVNGRLKRKWKGQSLETKQIGRKNFEFAPFLHPVLFVGHLSKSCLLVLEKPWSQVVKSFDTQPVDRHIYGT